MGLNSKNLQKDTTITYIKFTQKITAPYYNLEGRCGKGDLQKCEKLIYKLLFLCCEEVNEAEQPKPPKDSTIIYTKYTWKITASFHNLEGKCVKWDLQK